MSFSEVGCRADILMVTIDCPMLMLFLTVYSTRVTSESIMGHWAFNFSAASSQSCLPSKLGLLLTLSATLEDFVGNNKMYLQY